MQAGRAHGFGSINVDLIYGLPKQTIETVSNTLDRVIALGSNRSRSTTMRIYRRCSNSQRRILENDLPSPDVKLQTLGEAIRRLTAAGYVHIGMDHFAKPGDELAVRTAARSPASQLPRLFDARRV